MFLSQKSLISCAFVMIGSMVLVSCSSPTKYQPRGAASQSSAYHAVKKSAVGNACASPYIVQPGDTLSGIARLCHVKMHSIAKLNQLLPPYIIYVKQELVLPLPKAASEKNYVREVPKIRTVTTVKKPSQNVSVHSDKKTQSSKELTAKALARPKKTNKKSQKSGAWIWPMHKGLSHRYIRDHAGLSVLEIYGVPGQKIKAVSSGKVVYAGNGILNFGWMLVIKHDNDYMSIYAHNSAVLVKEGEYVEAGRVVATLGATGNTKRPKLYLEARYHGRKVDIKKLLKP